MQFEQLEGIGYMLKLFEVGEILVVRFGLVCLRNVTSNRKINVIIFFVAYPSILLLSPILAAVLLSLFIDIV